VTFCFCAPVKYSNSLTHLTSLQCKDDIALTVSSKSTVFAVLGRKQPLTEQDSIAIAKKTVRCAQYMGALKSFESPHYAPGYFSRNL